MNSSGRQPPRERVEEKILQEARQNRLPPPSRNQKRPVTPGKSGGRGTPLPHSHEVQRQPLLNPYITGKHSFEASLDSAQRRNFEKRQGATGRSFHAKTAVMKPSMSQGLYSFSGGKQIAPRIRGQPSLARPGEHYHSSSKEHETAGMQRQDFSTPHGHRLGEKSPKTPHRRQHGESSSTLKSNAQSSAPATSTHASASHTTSSSERGKIVNPNYRPLASTYAKSGTEQGQHSRSDSQPRHHGEGSTAPSNADTVRDGYKSHHSSKPKGRHHSESSSQPHGAETVKDGYKLKGRSRHYSESSTKHHNGHTVKDRDTCKSHVHQEQSRRPSESCSKISEIDAIKERRKAQEAPHPRPRHHSESGDRHTVSDKKKANEVLPHRQRSHSELSHKYHHLGPVKRKKSSEAPKVKLSESIGVLHDASHEEEMLACKQQNTMMWLLNSTQTVEENQSSPPKQLKQKTHDQNHSPSTDHHRGSFIVVEDKAGWARRIYSDGSSGVTSGMEPAGRSSHSSVDSSGCQKRPAEGNKELHLVKKSKMQRKNSSSSASHQSGPSYVKLLSMAKQNLSNGHNASESKTSDNVPDRIRKNSHQSGSGSDPEHQPSCRNLQEPTGILYHDFDEEKVERLFKASLSARPKLMQQSPAPVDKQKVRKQSSVESEVSLDSCVNSSNSNGTDKISLEKVGRLFNASLNTKSKTAESPATELKAAKCHLEDAQSPERPQYTCSLSGGKTSSDQSDKRITMSFRKVHSSKKYLAAQRHKFHEKSIKRLRLEASSRAVRIPVKRLRLKSDRIFLTDDFLQRLGRSSSIIVNTARKHNVPHGKKSKGHKHKTRRRVLPLYSSSDPDTPSVSNSHQPPLQREIPLRHSMSDTAAMSESSVSSGVATLFQELSSDPSKMDQPSCSSSPVGLQGRSKVKASPKFSGNISKLKQRIGKRLEAAVHGDKPQYSYTGNKSDSTIFGSSAAEGYSFGDSDYIPFSSEDVIFEETVEATEIDDKMNAEDGGDQGVMSKKEDETDLCLQTDPLAEPLISDGSEDDSSSASVSCPKLAPQADPCDSMPDLSENDDADEDCTHPAADGTSDSGRNAVPNEQPLSDRDLPQLSVRDNDHPALVPETFQGDVIPDLLAETQPKVDPPVLQSSEQPLPFQLCQTKVPEEQHTGELLEDTTGHAAGEPEEGCSGEALDDSESLPDVDLNAGDEDHRDVHENSSDSMEMDFNLSQVSTDDSHPANTPTTIMKEVSQIGNVPLPGTPSKPYPFPLNDSMSPGRQSQEMAAEEPTTKKRKLISLDKMLDMKKKTDNFAATFDRLKEDVSQGGFVRQMEEQQKTGNGDQDDGSGDELKDQEGILSKKLLQKYDVPEEPKIPIVHPGEDVFDQTKLRQIFKYDDHMASLAGCEFKPDKPSALESLMLKATPDEMVEMLRTFAVEMAYHSKPCPPAFMLWLFRLMSVHTDCNVVNKVYQTMWSILNAWPVEHPDIVPWAPSVADLTQILVNYGASFNELLPPGLVHPEFRENDIRPPCEEGRSDQETERVQPSAPALTDAEKARYHGNNLVKVIKILTLALVTRKTMDKFPYSEEEVCCLAVLICKTSLEKYFIRKAAENDFSLCLVALFACVPEASWKSQAERLCHVLPHVAIHHHNLAYITHLMPNCTERGRYMSRQLAYMCLKKLSSDEAEHNVNGFHPDLKVQDILDIISSARPHDKTDYYQLHSMIQILDLAIGNEVLDTSEKESLQSLNKKLNLFRASIKEKANSISRSQVKDLIVRMTLRLTLMDQAIVSDQVNLFNRFLPLSKIKEENVEEHFPTSQEDAVSISSEEGDEKLDALDEELEEEEEEKEAPSLTAVQSLEKR